MQMSSSGSFSLSDMNAAVSNRAGNDEESVELDDAQTLDDLGETRKEVAAEPPDVNPSDARCQQVTDTSSPGKLECVPADDVCALPNGIGDSSKKCKEAWGIPLDSTSKLTCPDGIADTGVFITAWSSMCARWDSTRILAGSLNCQKRFDKQDKLHQMVCTKASVKHADHSSRRAGILMMKRTKCVSADGNNFKCGIFKTGQCIDVGEDVWDHFWNDPMISGGFGLSPGSYAKGARAFAAKATKILADHRGKDLPEKYQCANDRHKHMDSCGDQQKSCCSGNKNCESKGPPYVGGCCSPKRNKEYWMQDKTNYMNLLAVL